MAYCAERGWTLWEGPAYSDPGVSAFGGQNLHHGALGRFLADLRAGRFGAGPVALLIEDVDRFSRAFPLEVLPVLIEDLLNAGVTVSVMARNKDYSRESMRSGQIDLIELLLCLGASHEFSQKLSRRLEHVHQQKRKQIRRGEAVTPGKAPSWLELGPGGQWQFTSYVDVVRRILREVEELGFAALARKLNAESIPSPGQAMRERRLGVATQDGSDEAGLSGRVASWSSGSVFRLVCNPAIHGARRVLQPGLQAQTRQWREEIARLRRQGISEVDLPRQPGRAYEDDQESYYPALLSPAEHSALLARIRQRANVVQGRADQLHWVAQGLTYCGCGSTVGALRTGKGQERGGAARYLRCHAKHKGLGCDAPMMRMVDAQAHLLTRLSGDSWLEILRSGEGTGRQSALASAIREQASALAEIAALRKALEAGEIALRAEQDAAVVSVLARRQAALEVQQSEAQQLLAATEGRLQQLQSGPSQEQLGQEAQGQVRELMATFAAEQDTVEDRRRVHAHLLRLGLRVTVDGQGKRIGLSIGEGPLHWQPLAPKARRMALELGSVDPDRAVDRQAGKRTVPVVIRTRSGSPEELEEFLACEVKHGADQDDQEGVAVELDWADEAEGRP